MYHHRNIKRFCISGVIESDASIPRFREIYSRILEDSMRIDGYVPRADIEQDFTIEYSGSSFEFQLSMYGVYVGRKKAECVMFLDGYRPHLMKSASSLPSET